MFKKKKKEKLIVLASDRIGYIRQITLLHLVFPLARKYQLFCFLFLTLHLLDIFIFLHIGSTTNVNSYCRSKVKKKKKSDPLLNFVHAHIHIHAPIHMYTIRLEEFAHVFLGKRGKQFGVAYIGDSFIYLFIYFEFRCSICLLIKTLADAADLRSSTTTMQRSWG